MLIIAAISRIQISIFKDQSVISGQVSAGEVLYIPSGCQRHFIMNNEKFYIALQVRSSTAGLALASVLSFVD